MVLQDLILLPAKLGVWAFGLSFPAYMLGSIIKNEIIKELAIFPWAFVSLIILIALIMGGVTVSLVPCH